MKRGHFPKTQPDDAGVANLIEYIMVTGILMALLIVMLLLVHANFVETPVNTLTYSAFTDIGNGLSTRIVDVYAVAPENGNITSGLNLPDEIGGRSYGIEISPDGATVDVSRDFIITRVAMAGVGKSKHGQAGGNTTGAGVNRVSYDSEGFE
jgi:hypothetical protein